MKYRVEVCSTVYEYRTVEVEAENEEDAGEKALDRICTSDPSLPDVPVERTDAGEHDVIGCEEV
jgi:hypothetical protein